MTIVVFESEPREAQAFRTLEPAFEVQLVAEPLAKDNAASFVHAEVVTTFIYSDLSRPVLEQLPKLRMIATRSTGFDHIDTGYCKAKGITVCNVPSYGESTVAEHVFALLLAISHRLPEALARARNGRFSPEGLEGFDLAGKVIGIVGTGSIGRHVIRIAQGFSMKVLAYDPFPDTSWSQELGFDYVTLAQLLGQSDIVSLHAPATDSTRHMLDRVAFASMKTGAVLINTARGSLVEPQALIEALTSGKLAFAGLDVLTDEPLIREEAELISVIFNEQHDLRALVADHMLLRLPNVLVTPHSGFNTREAVERIVQTTVFNIECFLQGRTQNAV